MASGLCSRLGRACMGLLAIAALAAAANHVPAEQPMSLDLHQGHMSRSTAVHVAASKKGRLISPYQQEHYWFYNFTIGDAELRTFVDTGSFDVVVLHGRYYKPSPKSQNLHETFVASFATTEPDGTGSVIETGHRVRDVVGVPPNLLVPNQEIGVVTNRTSTPPSPIAANAEAIMGLNACGSEFTTGRTRNWFRGLCTEGLVSKCRFGLAFGTNKKGKMMLGGVDRSLYSGSLTTLPVTSEWDLFGDVIVNNKTYAKQVLVVTDSGTTTILGPRADVRAIFKKLNLTIEESKSSLRGIYPCHKHLDFGFRFPATSKEAETFNVLPSAMAFQPAGNGTCYAALESVSTFNEAGVWLIGQAFMQGLYIDHDLDSQTMGFAPLKSSKF